LLAVHLLPTGLGCTTGCCFAFVPLFHANCPMLNSTWLGPVGET
jgi:hypothetical protein